MQVFSSLTRKRKGFLNQIYNIIDNQFKKQEEDFKAKTNKEIIQLLENNFEYIQRIFIDGSWGTGKSYFCEALKEKINEENKIKEQKINFIKINAWETDFFSNPMKSLIGEISSNIELTPETTKKAERILKNGLTIFGKAILNKGLEKIGLSETKREELEKLFKELNQFENSELEEYIKYKELVNDFKITLITKEKDLKVIVIDELDRCKPTYAIELLETIKHFFGVKNIIFIFLVNMEQLKSIASASYLAQDKCSEYFEKFYDIKFSLPPLEYEDFLQIEYDKYNKLNTYKPNLINGTYVSNESNIFYENLFMEAFKSNCDGESVAPRSFIKSFKKFSLLLLSLSNDEKACYPLMIVFILYFIREEFLNKKENTISLTLLYLKTFFEKNNSNLLEKELEEHEFNTKIRDTIRLKKKYSNLSFYKNLYLTLKYKVGKKGYDQRFDSEFLEYTVELTIEKVMGEMINIQLENINIYLGNIFMSIKYPYFLFENLHINKFEAQTFHYNTDLLEAWAKEKYSFALALK